MTLDLNSFLPLQLKARIKDQSATIQNLSSGTERSKEAIQTLKAQLEDLRSSQSLATASGLNLPVGRRSGSAPPSPGQALTAAVNDATVQLQAELKATREEAARSANEFQSKVLELREKLASATADAQRQASKVQDATQTLEDLRGLVRTEQLQRQMLEMDKARVEGLWKSSQEQISTLKRQGEEIQSQLSSRTQRLQHLEADVAVQRSSLERVNSELSSLSSEKSRLTVELMSATRTMEIDAQSHRLSTQELQLKISTLESELLKSKETYDKQQNLYHESISSANGQVRSARDEVEALKKSRGEVEARLEAAALKLNEAQGSIAALGAKVAESIKEAADLREVLSKSGRAAQVITPLYNY